MLRHRIITNFHAQSEGITTDMLIVIGCSRPYRCRARACEMARATIHGESGFPARASWIPWCSRASGTWSSWRARSSTASSTGLHKAPYFGASVDFAEHRGYVPGDDIRRMDWRLWARTDRLLHQGVRGRVEHELLGAAGRVEVDGLRQHRHHQARLRACLRHASPTSCITSATGSASSRSTRTSSSTCRRRPSTWRRCCTCWIGSSRAGRARLKEPLHKLAEHFGRRGVLVVISDFYEDPETVVDAVTPLRFRGNDLIVFHVLDPAELEFGFTDAQPFEDLESGDQMPVVPEAIREEYRLAGRAHMDALQQRFSRFVSITRCSIRRSRSITRCFGI